MEFALRKLYDLSFSLQKVSSLLLQISVRVQMRVSSKRSIPCDGSCWNKNEYKSIWDSWILKSQNSTAFEPVFLSPTLYLSPTAAISTLLSHSSEWDILYQVAADVLCPGWQISISFSNSDWADRSYTLSGIRELGKHLLISPTPLQPSP